MVSLVCWEETQSLAPPPQRLRGVQYPTAAAKAVTRLLPCPPPCLTLLRLTLHRLALLVGPALCDESDEASIKQSKALLQRDWPQLQVLDLPAPFRLKWGTFCALSCCPKLTSVSAYTLAAQSCAAQPQPQDSGAPSASAADQGAPSALLPPPSLKLLSLERLHPTSVASMPGLAAVSADGCGACFCACP